MFNKEQIEQIVLGQSEDLDVSKYAKERNSAITMYIMRKSLYYGNSTKNVFDQRQKHIIQKGFKEKLNVDIYANPIFNADQMEEIYFGLQQSLDATIFAKPEYTAPQIELICRGLKNGINILPYIEKKYSVVKICSIIQCLEHKIDIKQVVNLDTAKANEIRLFDNLLFKKSVNISKFLGLGYNTQQLKEIAEGAELGLDMSNHITPECLASEIRKTRIDLIKQIINEYNSLKSAKINIE